MALALALNIPSKGGSSHDDNNDDSGHVDAVELSGRLMVVF